MTSRNYIILFYLFLVRIWMRKNSSAYNGGKVYGIIWIKEYMMSFK